MLLLLPPPLLLLLVLLVLSLPVAEASGLLFCRGRVL